MTVDLPAPTSLEALLAERPALSRAANARALDELVAHERARQDGRLAVLRRLRAEADRMLMASDAKPALSGIGDRLRTLLRRRRARGPTTERELRARYEDAQLRARRAFAFAETLADLARELVQEDGRLRALLDELQRDDATLSALLVRLRGVDDPHDRARHRASELEALRDATRATEDRLLKLVESERMLFLRVEALRADIERSAQQASGRLDDVATALRTLATHDDAQRVMADLERALADLFGALDATARQVRDAGPPS